MDYSGTTSGVVVDLAAGTATGGDGNDTLCGIEGIIGSRWDDTLNGNDGGSTIRAGAGSDILKAGAGADKLLGEGNNDTLKDGGGADTLLGGTGDDRQAGGAGADVFEFNGTLNEGNDAITDFANGTDVIRIDGALFGNLTIAAAPGGANTSITFDSGTVIILDGVDPSQIDAGDFLFV